MRKTERRGVDSGYFVGIFLRLWRVLVLLPLLGVLWFSVFSDRNGSKGLDDEVSPKDGWHVTYSNERSDSKIMMARLSKEKCLLSYRALTGGGRVCHIFSSCSGFHTKSI